MAAGDIAAAAGMAIYDGNEAANQLWVRDNEILDQVAIDRTAVRAIARGGTGGASAAAARTALAVPALADVFGWAVGESVANKITRYNGSGQLIAGYPGASNHAATKQYVDTVVAGGSGWNGGTVTGQIYLPNAFAASSGYTVCYINGDGRISRGASALRFKKYVSEIDPLGLGRIFPQLVRYKHRSAPDARSDEAWHYGHIADWLAADPELQPFAVYETEDDGLTIKRDSFGLPVPLSIDFIALLLAQTAQLDARDRLRVAEIATLTERVTALEKLVEQLVEKGQGA